MEERHPYYDEYKVFVEDLYADGEFIKEMVQLYEDLCVTQAPTWQTHGSVMNDQQASLWMLQNLREQCELLEIFILFYKNCECPAEQIVEFAAKFKRQAFGRRQLNKHLLDVSAESLLDRIGFLQVMLLVEGMNLEEMLKCCANISLTDHHVFKSKDFSSLNKLLSALGDNACHGPLLLMWSAVQQLWDPHATTVIKKLGNKAMELRVFTYLKTHLEQDPFSGKTKGEGKGRQEGDERGQGGGGVEKGVKRGGRGGEGGGEGGGARGGPGAAGAPAPPGAGMVANVCYGITYSLLSTVLTLFHEESLGQTLELYALISTLLKKCFLASNFWEIGMMEGIGSLLQSALTLFPLESGPLLQLLTALAIASKDSAAKVVLCLKQMSFFMEMDEAMNLIQTEDKTIWCLAQDRHPYGPGLMIIPQGTRGRLCPEREPGVHEIQWEVPYDGWTVFVGEIRTLLQQVSQGAGMVQPALLHRVVDICGVLHGVLQSNPKGVEQMVSQLPELLHLVYQVIQRFCLLSMPSLELIAVCLRILTEVARTRPKEVWHGLQQTGLLPFAMEPFTDIVRAASGSGLNTGRYGSLLAGFECTTGRYSVTTALLQLLPILIKPLHKEGTVDELMPCVLFVAREIFPVFQKWRYYEANTRIKIGQQCLEIFHCALNILGQDIPLDQGNGVSLRDMCVHCLLFTESGRTLLDIISLGVDTVELALASQHSSVEGEGTELVQLVLKAFSVLNRLLLLRPPTSAPSPVEHVLSVQPANEASRHVAATIAQYVFHRHDPRLPTLTTLLLKRLAQVFPMSILACLGNDAESIRDMYLARLHSNTEDIQLKVVILELLSVCVETQPGLIEMFINMQSKDKEKKQVTMSCLQTVQSLISAKKQGTYHCPSELLCAALEFLHALWEGRQEVAMSVLTEKDDFWQNVCLSLTRDLKMFSDKEVNPQVLNKETDAVSYIMRIIAMEQFTAMASNKMDKKLEAVMADILNKGRLDYWSQYLCDSMKLSSKLAISMAADDPWPDNDCVDSTLKLLLAWRHLILVLASSKREPLSVKTECRQKLLNHLLEGIESQFCNNLTVVHVKLAAVASAFYLTLLKHWIRSVNDWCHTIEQLQAILTHICTSNDNLIPSVLVGIMASLTHVLQHLATNKVQCVERHHLQSLVPIVCSVLQLNTNQLPMPVPTDQVPDKKQKARLDVQLKLQVVSICLLEELIASLDATDTWLPIVKQHSLLECLLASAQVWIQALQGIKYVRSVLMLFLALSKYPEAATALTMTGLSQQLCVSFCRLYAVDHPTVAPSNVKPVKVISAMSDCATWVGVYNLGIELTVAMLTTLKFSFLDDAFNFVGVHQDRLKHSLECVGVILSEAALIEAEHTCRFLCELSRYRQQWHLHLPEVLNSLMLCVCQVIQRTVALLARPRLLQHLLEKANGRDSSVKIGHDKLLMTPHARRLSQQSSNEDVDWPSNELVQTQTRLLQLLSHCLASLRHFTPDLCEILLDNMFDVSQYEPLLQISFNSPSVEQDSSLSFGTLITCVNTCMRIIMKMDAKNSSPLKSLKPDSSTRRELVVFVLENALNVIMSQAVHNLRNPQLSTRDKQLVKRELSAELNSFLMVVQRHLRRGGASSPAGGTASNQPFMASQVSVTGSRSQLHTSFSSSNDQAYFKMVDAFVRQVLR
ncbi:Nucleoporin NUP188-like protein [Lamellibrachia satsuma]|nr:Nucleoporin NUP188-like protein [Lamellibrachia satsuma]